MLRCTLDSGGYGTMDGVLLLWQYNSSDIWRYDSSIDSCYRNIVAYGHRHAHKAFITIIRPIPLHI
jgi:hypothetical protein